MSLFVVPNSLSKELYKRIDAQLALNPSLVQQRENIYHELLKVMDDTGSIPDFQLQVVSSPPDPRLDILCGPSTNTETSEK